MSGHTEHTPTPWVQHVFAVMAGRDQIAHTGLGGLPPSRSHESEANAAFIVQACNAYDSDQRIIAELRDALGECATRFEKCMIRSGSDPEVAAIAVETYRAARAAS